MGINLNLDYSTLFSSLSSRSTSSSSSSLYDINLADYASIKNGSYYQVAKSYYAKQNKTNSTTGDNSNTTTSDKANASSVQSNADSLKDAADKLYKTGKNSLFNKKEITTKNEDGTTTTKNDFDKDAIYKAVKSFADSYNTTLKSGSASSNTNVLRQTLNMKNNVGTYKNMLDQIGITIGTDNKLSVDETTFKNSDMNTVKTLFNGTNSLAYNTSMKASQISYYADKATSTYNFNGALNGSYSVGSSYNNYF